jgi:hypothetical protein
MVFYDYLMILECNDKANRPHPMAVRACTATKVHELMIDDVIANMNDL